MNKQVGMWAGGVITMLTLAGLVGAAAIRFHDTEMKAKKVDAMEWKLNVVFIYLELKDPPAFEQAKKMAN